LYLVRFKGLTEVLLEIKIFLGCDSVHFRTLGTTRPMTWCYIRQNLGLQLYPG